MNQTLLQSVENSSLKAVQDIKPGYTVKVYQKIKEGDKERIQLFEGLVIAVKGQKGTNQTITVRRVVSGVGVEKIFPVHASTIEKIEIVKIAKIRRAKLYYMRERSGKSARLKEQHIGLDHEANKLHDYKIVEQTVSEDTTKVETPTKKETSADKKVEASKEEPAETPAPKKEKEEVAETKDTPEDKVE